MYKSNAKNEAKMLKVITYAIVNLEKHNNMWSNREQI